MYILFDFIAFFGVDLHTYRFSFVDSLENPQKAVCKSMVKDSGGVSAYHDSMLCYWRKYNSRIGCYIYC